MSSKGIKGLTVEIGGETSKLEKALEGVTKTGKSLSSELNSINKLLKLDPTNTELLAQKQQILGDAISNTEERLRILKEAEKQAQAQFEKGEISAEQYRGLQREIAWAETNLKQYQRAVVETTQATEKLSDSTDGATQGLNQQEKQTEETKRETIELDDSMGDAVKGGFAALIAAASAAIAAIAALAESTREYRTEMGKLDTAYKASGHSTETATAAYKELQSVIGETDQAVEAAQQIALLADSEKQVAEWSDLAAGLVGRLGDALKPETFYEAANETLKLGEATGAWTQMLEQTGANVEEFNAGLQACATSAEKQAYMLNVARKALGPAAAQYKATNKEIIRANAANEDWNATLAEAGEIVEPVVTDVKELGTALLKKAKQPLQEVATYIRNTFLPALTKVGSWAKQNLPQISASIAGVTGALVAHKIATMAAKLAADGWTIATLAQAAAQKVLNAVMSATPWGLALTAVAGITSALVAYGITTEAVKKNTDYLTESERALVDAANDAAQAFRDQQAATTEQLEGLSSQSAHVQSLADELRTLADESGKVQESDQARVKFILNELNSALGTEYEMVGNVIRHYDSLRSSVDKVIESKLANSLLEYSNAEYLDAVMNETKALEAMNVAQEAYESQLEKLSKAEEAYADKMAEVEKQRQRLISLGYGEQVGALKAVEDAAKRELNAVKSAVAGSKAEYDNATRNYANYYNTISRYQAAQTAALEGDYSLTVDILRGKSREYELYGQTLHNQSLDAIADLRTRSRESVNIANDTTLEIGKTLEQSGTTMAEISDRNYGLLMNPFASAYDDGRKIGNDLGAGLSVGMLEKKKDTMAAAAELAEAPVWSMRNAVDSHSPAKKTIEVGEDMGEGTEIGIDNKTKDVARAGERQAEALLDAYRSQELRGQNVLRGIADRQAAAQAGSYMSAGAQNAGVLNKILAAIEKGQVLTINRDLLVGATEGAMDSALGARQILVERGAL